jgi:transcription initiation factor TFIID subunit 3
VLKKKHDKTEDGSRYYGTIFGNPTEPRPVTVEGGEITSLKDWEESLRNRSTSRTASTNGSRPGSSDLSSLGDQYMEGMDFD